MKFSITSGHPTDEELLALQAVLANHKSVDIKPVIKRSIFAIPQLRPPHLKQLAFGLRKKE